MDNKKIKKILIIKLRGIGDVVLSSIIFDNIIKSFPQAEIDYLTEKPSQNLLEPLPFISKVFLFNRKSTTERIKQIFEIRKQNYDLVIDLFSNPSTALITFFSGALYRIGFPYKGRKYAYNIYGPVERGKYHAAELHVKLLESAGINIFSRFLQIGIPGKDKEFADNFFRNNYAKDDLIIGISPSGGWQSKKCPKEVLLKISKKIIENINCKLLVVWGPGDKEDADYLINNISEKIIISPDTSITQMAALISNCNYLVANDSGPMHISTAVNTPVFGLFGPTNPKLQGPYGISNDYYYNDKIQCICCNLLTCDKNQECFRNIDLNDFMDRFLLFMKKKND